MQEQHEREDTGDHTARPGEALVSGALDSSDNGLGRLERHGKNVVLKYAILNSDLLRYIGELESNLRATTESVRRMFIDKCRLERREAELLYKVSTLGKSLRDKGDVTSPDELGDLRKRVNELEGKGAELRSKLNEKRIQIDYLIDALDKKGDRMAEFIRNLTNRNSELEASNEREVKEMERIIEKQRKDIEEIKAKGVFAESQEDASRRGDAIRCIMRYQEKELDEVKRELKESLKENVELKMDLKFKIIENENLTEKNTELGKLVESLEDTRVEIKNMKHIIRKKDEEIKKRAADMEAMAERYNKLVLENKGSEMMYTAMSEVEKLQKELSHRVEKEEQFKKDIDEQMKEIKSSNERIAELNQANQSLIDANEMLRRQAERYACSISGKTSVMNEMEAIILGMSAIMSQVYVIMSGISRNIADAKKVSREAIESINERRVEATNALEEILSKGDSTRALALLGKERYILMEENDDLKGKIKQLKDETGTSDLSKYVALKRRYKKVKGRSKEKCSRLLTNRRKRENQMNNEIEKLKGEIADLSNRIDEQNRIGDEERVKAEGKISSLIDELKSKEQTIERYAVIIEKLNRVKEAYLKLRSIKDAPGTEEDAGDRCSSK